MLLVQFVPEGACGWLLLLHWGKLVDHIEEEPIHQVVIQSLLLQRGYLHPAADEDVEVLALVHGAEEDLALGEMDNARGFQQGLDGVFVSVLQESLDVLEVLEGVVEVGVLLGCPDIVGSSSDFDQGLESEGVLDVCLFRVGEFYRGG